MKPLLGYSAYLPAHRLGQRVVAGYDEDSTTMAVTASGVDSGRLVITQFEVTGGTFQGVPFDAASDPASPQVETSNWGDGTVGGPTNITGAENSAGPEKTPGDTQNCTTSAAFWTPNC